MATQRWEYTSVYVAYRKQTADLPKLNSLGSEGWELVSAVPHIDRAPGLLYQFPVTIGITYIFKRPA